MLAVAGNLNGFTGLASSHKAQVDCQAKQIEAIHSAALDLWKLCGS